MTNFTPEEITECNIISACSRLWNENYYKFRNFFYRHDHEADLFVISKAGYATEVEVKITLSDWRADLKKKKHSTHKFIKHFYYAVPEYLSANPPEGIDPRYGMIVVAHDGTYDGLLRARVVKNPETLPHEKVSNGIYCRAFKSAYYRNFALITILRNLRYDAHVERIKNGSKRQRDTSSDDRHAAADDAGAGHG